MCLDCNKLIILGDVTKKLPDDITYCDGTHFAFGSIHKENSYSYDSIIKYINEHDESKNQQTQEEPIYKDTQNVESQDSSNNQGYLDLKDNFNIIKNTQ